LFEKGAQQNSSYERSHKTIAMIVSPQIQFHRFKSRFKFEDKKLIEEKWDKEFGDRLNELVIIGQDMIEKEIREDLEACLCTPEEVKWMHEKKYTEDAWPLGPITCEVN
jgi:G3E family GTPase